MPWNPECYNVMKSKVKRAGTYKAIIIHTKTFSCANDHPIVWYTFDNKIDSTDKTDKGYVVCEYCYDKFIYEPEDDDPEPIDDYVNRILKGSG